MNVAQLKSTRFIVHLLLTLILTVPVASITASAQGFVYNFPLSNGSPVFPNGSLAQGRDGNLYGMALDANNVSQSGTIYRLTPSGSEAGIYVLPTDGSQGYDCHTGLTLGTDGNFYGACSGSSGGYGTLL